MSPEAVNQLQILLQEDVEAFASLLRSNFPLPPHHVRIITSSILRRWFIDGRITQLGNALGCTFSFPTLDTQAVFDKISEQGNVRFFMAGGVYLGGRMSQGVYVSDEPYTDRPIIPVDQMEYVDLKFGSFVSQKRIFHDGYSFRTRDVITHVSNKLGGVHFDPSRRSDVEVALDRAASYCLLGNPTGETDEKIVEDDQRILIVLPKEQGYVWNCLDVEMLAAAQSFMNLKIDSQKFLIMGDAPERT